MIGQKPLGTLNYATRSIISVRKIKSNEYNRNIKVVPLGDVNIFMLKTRSLETIFIAICILPKSGVNRGAHVRWVSEEKGGWRHCPAFVEEARFLICPMAIIPFLTSDPASRARVDMGAMPDCPLSEYLNNISVTNSKVESAMNHRRQRDAMRDPNFTEEAFNAFSSADAYIRAARDGLAGATYQLSKDMRVRLY